MVSLSNTDVDIYRKVKAAKNGSMVQAQIEAAFPGMRARDVNAAIASLITAKLLVTTNLKSGEVLFRASDAEEAVKKIALTDDQKIVLHVVTQAGSKGLNFKQIRAQVPNTIIPNALRKALDILEKNEHIKTFRSVNAPTIPLYCAFHLDPPVEITGGVWYDDAKEYDHNMVEGIRLFLLNYVRSLTFPKIAKIPASHLALVPNPIFPLGRTKNLPSPHELLKAIIKYRVTPSKLKVKNVMEVMRALELDGLIEVVKPLQGVEVPQADDESEDEEPRVKRRKIESDKDLDSDEREGKEEKEKEKARERAKARRKKEKEKERRLEVARAKEKRRRRKEKEKEKREKEKEKKRRKGKDKKQKKRVESDQDSGEDSDDELKTLEEVERADSRKKSSKSKRKRVSPSSDDSDGDSDSDSDDSDSSEASVSATLSDSSVDSNDIDHKRLTSKPSANNFAASHTPLAPAGLLDLTDTAIVYRALNRMSAPLGQTEISCGKCPAFSFCEEDGPVNPAGCEYLDHWLSEKGGWEASAQGKVGRANGKGKERGEQEIAEADDEYEDEMMAVDE